ncbi:MAG: response regulator transcription factor [Alphaproteobacteria bacterium]|nr:response regulator transcription factor [Alphaproteobacteria bacterium]
MSKPLKLAIAVNDPTFAQSYMRRVGAALGRRIEGETVVSLPALRARLRSANLPPLVLVDCALHGLGAPEGLAALHHDRPEARLVALVETLDGVVEAESARAGARATLDRAGCPRHAGRVLEIVSAGSSYMSADALMTIGDSVDQASHALVRKARVQAEAQTISEPLTEREATILAHIRTGATNRAIGDVLGVDENRVKIHVRAIFRKIGAKNRTEAALKATTLLLLPAPGAAAVPASIVATPELRAIA